ncbi:hypothetical protein PI124_g17378 [Phytophthora idaei]|nr:hypothetical protein PI124_g17378 [Phytophthora idaei]
MRVSEVAAEQANQSTSEGEVAADIVLPSDGMSVRQSSLSAASTEPESRKLEPSPEQQVLLRTAVRLWATPLQVWWLSPEHDSEVSEETVLNSMLCEQLQAHSVQMNVAPVRWEK